MISMDSNARLDLRRHSFDYERRYRYALLSWSGNVSNQTHIGCTRYCWQTCHLDQRIGGVHFCFFKKKDYYFFALFVWRFVFSIHSILKENYLPIISWHKIFMLLIPKLVNKTMLLSILLLILSFSCVQAWSNNISIYLNSIHKDIQAANVVVDHQLPMVILIFT